MARIEINGAPEELERVAVFLKKNNIKFGVVDDFANYSSEESLEYKELMLKYND